MSDQKIVLITGTSRGIGKDLAKYFLEKKYLVIGCSRESVAEFHENYKHYSLSVSDEEKVLQLFRDIKKKYGRLDVLINNAGIHSINHAMLTPTNTVREIFEANMIGGFIFSREAAKVMMLNRFGRIINFSTVAVPLSSLGTSIYTASKSALEQFSNTFSKEVADLGITINTIGLSIVKDVGMSKNISDQATRNTLDTLAIKYPAELIDITHTLDFLISENARMITRQIIYLGGI